MGWDEWEGRNGKAGMGWEGRDGKGGMGREGRHGRDGMGRKHGICECTGENE